MKLSSIQFATALNATKSGQLRASGEVQHHTEQRRVNSSSNTPSKSLPSNYSHGQQQKRMFWLFVVHDTGGWMRQTRWVIQFLSPKRCQDLLRQYERTGNYFKLHQVAAIKLLLCATAWSKGLIKPGVDQQNPFLNHWKSILKVTN